MGEKHAANNRVCPVCSHRTGRRISRKWWMRLMRHSRYYSCSTCSSRFMVLADDRVFVLRNGLSRGKERKLTRSEVGEVHEGHTEEAGAPPVTPAFAHEEEYARLRARAIAEAREALVPWTKKRFWVFSGVTLLALLALVPLTVRLMLTREYRAASRKAAQAEGQLQAMQQEAEFYKGLVRELEAEIRKAEESLQRMEARVAAASGGIAVGAATVGVTGTTGEGKWQSSGAAGGTGSILEQEARKQLMQENAAYKVIVFTSKGPNDLLAQRVVERLQADNFRVTSIIVPPREGTRSVIQMECTLEAAQKARELRDFVERLAVALVQEAREVRLRYSITEEGTAPPPEKREIRIFF